MWAILESVLRAAVSVAPFLERWLKKQPTPDPIETVRVVGDMALIDIENRGLAAEFTAQIVKVVNVEGWPHKTVWVRWDHDKDARSMRIARKTSAQIRVATKFDRPKRGLKAVPDGAVAGASGLGGRSPHPTHVGSRVRGWAKPINCVLEGRRDCPPPDKN
jgi:hypothetical protein